jgi:hypothetical protein
MVGMTPNTIRKSYGVLAARFLLLASCLAFPENTGCGRGKPRAEGFDHRSEDYRFECHPEKLQDMWVAPEVRALGSKYTVVVSLGLSEAKERLKPLNGEDFKVLLLFKGRPFRVSRCPGPGPLRVGASTGGPQDRWLMGWLQFEFEKGGENEYPEVVCVEYAGEKLEFPVQKSRVGCGSEN